MAFDRSGTLWVAAGNRVYSFDGETWTAQQKSAAHCSALLVDHSDILWLTTEDGRIQYYSGGSWNEFQSVPEDLRDREITDVTEDADDVLWFSAVGALASYDRGTWSIYTTENSRLVDDRVRTVTIDHNNVVWAGTDGGITSFYKELETGVEETMERPVGIDISGNFPNPFNASTTIEFTLPASENVSLVICNVLGQRVRRLIDGRFTPGRHAVRWDGLDDDGMSVSSGVYLAFLMAGQTVETHRMLFLK